MVAKSPRVSMQEQLQASASQIWSSMKHLEQTIKASPDKANNDDQEGAQVSLESVIRIMFGSCTAGMTATEEHDTNGAGSHSGRIGSRKMSQSTCEPASPTQSEDNLYKNLFEDEHMKAEDAVCHLREQMEQQRALRSPPRNIAAHKSNYAPKLFPASSPKEKKKANQPPVKEFSASAPGKTQAAGNEGSFDDEISALSQHTLEELAAIHQGYNGFLDRVHSDVTQDPVEALEESWKNTVDPNRGSSPHRMSSPLQFQRTGRSHGGRSHGTLNTKQTIGTKSTMSSQTNEFASFFRKDEQQYWQDVVQEQDESQDPAAGSVGISNRHEQLVKARERVRRREWVGFSRSSTRTIDTLFYSQISSS
jgi:hypothetical protein